MELETKKLKVLNLYAGIGGNRKLWENVEITAIENDKKVAKIYQELYPCDNDIIADAHKYLLENFDKFDLVWSSFPCQSHSQIRQRLGVKLYNVKPIYPELGLYQEIIFLKHHSNKLWVVENVSPYYNPLIPATKIGKHLFWSNFYISEFLELERYPHQNQQIPQLQEIYGFDLSNYQLPNKRQVLRNCVSPQIGKHILDCALNKQSFKPLSLFEL